MFNNKLQIWDSQAETYIEETEHNIAMLRQYGDNVTARIADNLERDLKTLKAFLKVEDLKHAS